MGTIRTAREIRERRRASVEKQRGVLVAFDRQRVKEMLAGSAHATVARLTKIDRRQVRRLAVGELPRTHMKTLRALAEWRNIDVDSLRANSARPAEPPGSFAASLLASDFTRRWGTHHAFAGMSGIFRDQFPRAVMALLSYDTWSTALYEQGLPIREIFPNGRPLRRNIRKIESRRTRFAKSLAEALDILLEGVEKDRLAVRANALSGLFQGFVGLLSDEGELAYDRNNPGMPERIRELVLKLGNEPPRQPNTR
jgi:hypothetical protein